MHSEAIKVSVPGPAGKGKNCVCCTNNTCKLSVPCARHPNRGTRFEFDTFSSKQTFPRQIDGRSTIKLIRVFSSPPSSLALQLNIGAGVATEGPAIKARTKKRQRVTDKEERERESGTEREEREREREREGQASTGRDRQDFRFTYNRG